MLYRGISIDDYDLPSRIKFFFPSVTSWTTAINVAEMYARDRKEKLGSDIAIVLRTTLGPEDILVDGSGVGKREDNWLYQYNEVRVRPGVYEVDIIRSFR